MKTVTIEIEAPDDLAKFRLPAGVERRLRDLLDRQDSGIALSADERREAEGLVDLAELLSMLKLKIMNQSVKSQPTSHHHNK